MSEEAGTVDSVDAVESQEVESAVEQEVDAGSESEASEAVQNMKRKLKLKIDGEEVEEEIDLSDEDALRRHLQLSKVAQKRMSEAARERKRAEEFMHRLKSNPIEVLNDPDLGVNFREIAEQYLAEQLEQEMMSPEEKRIKQAEQIIREREEEQRKAKEREQNEEVERLKNHYSQDYEKKITTALETGGLPKTPKTVRRMAELMKMNLSHGLDLEPTDLVTLVREDYVKEIKEIFGSSEGDQLLGLLGDDIANKIRKSDLQKLKSKMPQGSSSKPSGSSPRGSQPRAMSRDEWREMYSRRVRD